MNHFLSAEAASGAMDSRSGVVTNGTPRVVRAAMLSLCLAMASTAMAEPAKGTPAPIVESVMAGETVNINTADAASLARVLKGVGQSKAEAIIEYRKANGDFVDIYELANVRGIGERTVELNESRIMLKD